MNIAIDLDLASRPVKLDMDQLSNLRLPCILHWNFNHFVVLHSLRKSSASINDPALGMREVSWAEFSNCFTGVALELWPGGDFTVKSPRPSIKLSNLIGRLTGLKKAIGQVAVVALALELIAAISPLFLQWLVDEVAISGDRDFLWSLTLGFGLLIAFKQILAFLRSTLVLYFNTSFSIQWRTNIFNHLVRLPVQYFEKRYLGDIVSRFESVEQIRNVLSSAFFESILDGLMTLFTLCMMFSYDVRLGFMVVLGIGLYAGLRCIWNHPQDAAIQDQILHTSKTNSHFIETLRGIKTIKLFHRHEGRRVSWTTLLVEQVNSEVRVNKIQIKFKILNDLLSGLNNIFVLAWGTKLILDNYLSIGALMAFAAYRAQFDLRATALIDKYWDYKMLRPHCDRLADIALAEPDRDSEEGIEELGRHPALDIRVQNVGFQYSSQDPNILNGVSFSVAPGESIAITGPSGCGKTTLMNILLGVLKPTEGDIFINGKSIQKFGNGAIRSSVAVVLQDDVLFAGSVSENISFFDPHVDEDWVRECASMAAVAEDIDAMPMGYRTLVGDMGTVLSGGQKQRILLARALYKKPRLLLLDEATSSLDVAKERQVNEAIKKLSITRIIIAHRPETIASADRVIRLHHGRVKNTVDVRHEVSDEVVN
jgi:ATP-binding cassette subfamily B protein RaxB